MCQYHVHRLFTLCRCSSPCHSQQGGLHQHEDPRHRYTLQPSRGYKFLLYHILKYYVRLHYIVRIVLFGIASCSVISCNSLSHPVLSYSIIIFLANVYTMVLCYYSILFSVALDTTYLFFTFFLVILSHVTDFIA